MLLEEENNRSAHVQNGWGMLFIQLILQGHRLHAGRRHW